MALPVVATVCIKGFPCVLQPPSAFGDRTTGINEMTDLQPKYRENNFDETQK